MLIRGAALAAAGRASLAWRSHRVATGLPACGRASLFSFSRPTRRLSNVATGSGIHRDQKCGESDNRCVDVGEEASDVADHRWRQMNHIWTLDELKAKFNTRNMKHMPQTLGDHVLQKMMLGMYHGFNLVTGYKQKDPSPRSIEWRLILLESFAGVPGFLAAMLRHFYSLRTLQRDHGRIYTLLEEAENERMHLLVCMSMFKAGPLTRAAVTCVQFSMVPFLLSIYLVSPSLLHRFVGYLEETAVHTYSNIIENIERPGTQLHHAWSSLPAPDIAKQYWQLGEHELWIDTLRHILADEAHHRDVNHTFADLPEHVDNPFIAEHKENFHREARRHLMNEESYEKRNMAKSMAPLHRSTGDGD